MFAEKQPATEFMRFVFSIAMISLVVGCSNAARVESPDATEAPKEAVKPLNDGAGQVAPTQPNPLPSAKTARFDAARKAVEEVAGLRFLRDIKEVATVHDFDCLEETADALVQALDKKPRSKELLFLKAEARRLLRAMSGKGVVEMNIGEFESALDIDPKYDPALRALQLRARPPQPFEKDAPEQLEYLLKSVLPAIGHWIQSTPGEAWAYHFRSLVHRLTDNWHEAYLDSTRAVLCQSRHFRIRLLRAELALHVGDLDIAVHDAGAFPFLRG